MMAISTRPLQIADEPAYRSLAVQDPRSLLYISLEWVQFLQSYLQAEVCLLGAFDGERLVGALPLLVREGPAGPVANSLPFYGSNGAILVDLNRKDGRAIRTALLDALHAHARRHDWLASTLITSPWESDLAFYEATGAVYRDERVGQLTPLTLTPGQDVFEGLMDKFHYKTRNMVRKSLKEEFALTTAWQPDLVDFLITTHQENIAAVGGLAKERAFFEQLIGKLPETHRRLYTALQGDKPVAAMLLLYFNETVEYFTPVIQAEHRAQQPLSFLIMSAMCDAVRAGFQWWNWGGTWLTQEGVYRFKSRWGTLDQPYFYFTYAHRDLQPLLQLGKTGLLQHYRHFFTVPFRELASAPAA